MTSPAQTPPAPSPVPRPFADHVADYALPCGRTVLVDLEDYDAVRHHDWRANPEGYVRATVDGTRVLLHRWLTHAKPGQLVDHWNRNPLDNRRANLRLCTPAQNSANMAPTRSNASGYKGVTWEAARGKWRASIQPRGRARILGRFDSAWEAAEAYNAAAIETWGEFAHLNVRIEAAG